MADLTGTGPNSSIGIIQLPAARAGDGVASAFPVLIEFPDLDAARVWYYSEEYRPLRELRHRSATANAVLLAADDPNALLEG